MMLETHIGAAEDEASLAYLRPETAQGIFTNFKNIIDSFHPSLPFGIAQIGKAFRNEIAPRDFLFRVRELEQMEVEYFVRPDAWKEAFEMWQKEILRFIEAVGIDAQKVSQLEIPDADRAHYSKRTVDFEFEFPFGRKELFGLAYRTDYDLKNHATASGVDLSYLEESSKEKFIPHVIEPSLGVGRTILAALCSAYTEDEMGGEKRIYLAFEPSIAPVKIAVFPLLRNKPKLVEKAREVYVMLNIGKRYRRQDEIGTPFCVTVDFDTIEKDDTVTVRDRDNGKQERFAVKDLISIISQKIIR
jgi:glycyl-tRNA synthetase